MCGMASTFSSLFGPALSMQRVLSGTGIVLAKEGGALGKMLPVFNIFAGGPLGTGRQWCSWIHRQGPGDRSTNSQPAEFS